MAFSPKLLDFCGEWRLSRRIQSEIAGQSGRFEGRAWFTPDDAGLLYREAGTLTVGAHEMEAERRYLWRVVEGDIAVFFEDGKPFHQFAPQQVAASHFCDPDTYNVTYDFANWPKWSSTWRVTGPRKDYVMTSEFTRAA